MILILDILFEIFINCFNSLGIILFQGVCFAIKLIHRLQEIIPQEVSHRANILTLRSFEKN